MVAGDTGQAGLSDFGPYRIQELLGQGGMGVVHRAYDTVHDRVIALKRLPATVTDRDYRARFQRESRIVAGLSHPNVVPVNDFGEIDGQLFLDMMLVDGIDLRRGLGDGTLDFGRAIKLLSQVAQALDAAHAGGLIHRDVKPSNILLTPEGHAYLADFGIARETSPEATALTLSGDLVGTWDYMAPERLSGGQVDGRADQYSLACVLFECLTGRLPHPATDPAAKVAAHLLQPPPAPSVFIPTVTPALDAVVLRGMAKDPGRRFPTATAMMDAAESAAYSGVTSRSAQPTASGPAKQQLVRAIVRSTAVRKTRALPHDYPPTSPYPGLHSFDRADADRFHGRGHVVTDLLVRLAEQLDGGEPVVLVGASGAGKSSVLHAGLLPALALANNPEQAAWPQIVLTPGVDPISNLAMAIAGHTTIAAAEWARVIRDTPARFGELCGRAVDTVRPVIVVDQFEELFTHGTPDADRLAFATALANARPALVILAVRADLVDRCIELTPLIPALTSPVLLGSMDATELRQAIVTPARDYGIDIEPGLPERLIADLGIRGEFGYDPGALPRLAHALRETWNQRDDTMLTLAAYRRAGGIDGAVSRTAEEIYARLDPAGQQALRTIMLLLVTVFDDGAVARRRVDPREFATISGHPGIVQQLITARLVTVDTTGARLSHEALLTAWPRLRDWIDEDRAGLIQHRRFLDSVHAWAESGQHDDDLYRGVRLVALVSWLESARDRVRLQPFEHEFLARSNAAEQAGQIAARRRTRRLRGMVTALSLLLVIAAVAGVVALKLRQNAEDERNRADSVAQSNLSRQLAAEATIARVVDPRRAALTALGASEAGATVEGRSALLATEADSYRGRMTGHQGAITSVTVSGDGKIAATGGRDGTLRLWDLPNRRQLAILDDKGGWYRLVALSADGRLLVAAGVDKRTVTVWSVPDRKVVFTSEASVDFTLSADGTRLAAFTNRGLTVWDTATFAEVAQFPFAVASIAMALSPDNTLIATTNDNNIEVRRVSDATVVATLTGHTKAVDALVFNKSGTLLGSGSADGTARLWDTKQWAVTHSMDAAEGGGGVSTVAFNPQGTALLAGGVSTAVTGWDPATGELLSRFVTGSVTTLGLTITGDGHTLLTADSNGVVTTWAFQRVILGIRDSAVLGVDFQPGGKLLATSAGDGSAQLWDSTNGDLVRRWTASTKEAYDVAFSRDGTEVATADGDGNVVLWDVATGKEKRRFSRPGTEFIAVVVSPDGKTIAVAGRAPTESTVDRDEVLLLRASDMVLTDRRPTRQEPRNPQANDVPLNHPNAVAFSPDGRTLAIALSAGKVGLWNLVDPGSELTILPGHDGIAVDVEFSPDGRTLATAGTDRLVRLWQVRDGKQIGVLTGHESTIRRVTFSPDGRTLATASQDTVLRLWDVATSQLIARLDRHDDDLNDVAFDATGQRIATTSADGTTRLWDLDPQQATRVVCGLLDLDTIDDDWRALGAGRGNPPTCTK
jgi:WD40 repeat protein